MGREIESNEPFTSVTKLHPLLNCLLDFDEQFRKKHHLDFPHEACQSRKRILIRRVSAVINLRRIH